jgi:hypothetical protein
MKQFKASIKNVSQISFPEKKSNERDNAKLTGAYLLDLSQNL